MKIQVVCQELWTRLKPLDEGHCRGASVRLVGGWFWHGALHPMFLPEVLNRAPLKNQLLQDAPSDFWNVRVLHHYSICTRREWRFFQRSEGIVIFSGPVNDSTRQANAVPARLEHLRCGGHECPRAGSGA